MLNPNIMRVSSKRLCCLIVFLHSICNSFAYDAEVDGVYYNFSGTTAEVTSGDSKYTGSVVIPEYVTYNSSTYSITSIGKSAFQSCYGLTSITIPNGVTSIGSYAFQFCNKLKSISIPTNVTSVGSYAFENCISLTSLTIPNSVTSIGDFAFAYCSALTSITISNSVTSIGKSVFRSCSALTSITIPNSVTSIGSYAFSGCSSLTSITIPNSVTSIGDEAFSSCSSLTSITIPNSVTSIGFFAFACCSSLSAITIPNSVMTIGESAFQQCSGLTSIVVESGNSVYDSRNNCNAIIYTSSDSLLTGCMNTTIPNSVTSIAGDAFFYCSGLISIIIPAGITSIGQLAFSDCHNLKEVKSEIINPFDIYEGVFRNISSDALLYVPKGTKEKYQAFTGWTKNFKEIIESTTDVKTYTLSIKATGKGSASYNGIVVKNGTTNFSVNSGTNANISFNPDNDYSIIVVKVNSMDVTSNLSNNQYTISNITANTMVEVVFGEEISAFTVDGLNYKVVSQADRTVNVSGGDIGQVLTVPSSVISNGVSWTVVGIEEDALSGNTELNAVIWNPEVKFNATVSNPNLLLYVKSEAYAPASIQNVVVNGTASNIVLKEASSGNNFYCPQAFTAQQISYTHNYQMQTGVGESRGWETIALPFDVQTITHETKGSIVPFAQWKSGDATKPFWLYELAGTGFVEANSIKAYTPYIISMPNNPQYDSEWLLNGKVTFAASGVVVGKTEDLNQPTFNNRIFIPCFADKDSDTGLYALNVNNDFETNNSGVTEGSIFMWKLRSIHPFEAFMTSSSSAPQYSFGVFEGMTTGIQMMVEGSWMKKNVVYDLQGRKVENPSKKGVYIVIGKKKIIK